MLIWIGKFLKGIVSTQDRFTAKKEKQNPRCYEISRHILKIVKKKEYKKKKKKKETQKIVFQGNSTGEYALLQRAFPPGWAGADGGTDP